MAAEHEGHEAVDALMAAITGERLPDAVLADARFMAEHRAARADVALLREQLAIIGEALSPVDAAPPPKPGTRPTRNRTRPARPRPPGKRARRPRARALGFGALGMVVVAAAVVGLGRLAHSGGAAETSDSGAKAPSSTGAQAGSGQGAAPRSPADYLACARLVVEGRVTGVESVPGAARVRITVTVGRYYKPASGTKEVTFLRDEDAEPPLRKGEHVLVGVPHDSEVPDRTTVGEKEIAADRAGILGALPASRSLSCE
ncbi:hypothetical protein [Streptomyces sp. TP-A0356]|uniref:hypothetical protein n=1 Tax=Streptomyces sp. TP-A0356 TaxID=1359208 RepID=UPI0006E12060|nr:hypothetical protein [Streptomyces sp. TP-A0356]